VRLTTAAELAEQFGITVERLHELRRARSWPHVRFSRFDFRFTAEQVEQIIAMQSVTPERSAPAAAAIPGQTARSRRRSA